MKHLLTGTLLLFSFLTTQAQKPGKFGADLGKKSVMGKEIRIPYTDLISYYGFIEPGAKPDEEKGGKKYYYVYIWIPAAAPEIGVRMISPVPEDMQPGEGDFSSAAYTKNNSDHSSFFDTWITFDRAVNILSLDDVKSKISSANWVSLAQNDDSGELPAQPSGSKYNSLIRVTSSVGDPLKSLTMGLYRVGFTTFKTGEVKGSFVAQIGAPVKLPGVKVAATPAALTAQ